MCADRTERQRLRTESKYQLTVHNTGKRYHADPGLDEGKEISMGKFVAITFGLLLVAAGSVRAQGVVLPLPPEDQQNITAQLGPNVIGAALPSQPISRSLSLLPASTEVPKLPGRCRPSCRHCTDSGTLESETARRKIGLAISNDSYSGGLHARDTRGRHHYGRPD